jgi:hypothetical protein
MNKMQDYKMVQISQSAHSKLKLLADNQKRSMAGQLEWLIEVAYRQVFTFADEPASIMDGTDVLK